jgi:hypothetical protein
MPGDWQVRFLGGPGVARRRAYPTIAVAGGEAAQSDCDRAEKCRIRGKGEAIRASGRRLDVAQSASGVLTGVRFSRRLVGTRAMIEGRRLSLAVAACIAARLALTASAAAGLRTAPFCDHSGGLSIDGKYETTAPFLISISQRTAVNLSRRAGYFEGAVATPPRAVPCNVAFGVALGGMNAWENWSGNTGWVGAGMVGSGARVYLGRFYCTGESTNSGGAIETCTHRANRHAGRIIVRFLIRPNPGSS